MSSESELFTFQIWGRGNKIIGTIETHNAGYAREAAEKKFGKNGFDYIKKVNKILFRYGLRL